MITNADITIHADDKEWLAKQLHELISNPIVRNSTISIRTVIPKQGQCYVELSGVKIDPGQAAQLGRAIKDAANKAKVLNKYMMLMIDNEVSIEDVHTMLTEFLQRL